MKCYCNLYKMLFYAFIANKITGFWYVTPLRNIQGFKTQTQ